MSQEKVDRYKQEKANRKQILKREKIKKNLAKVAVAVVLIIVIAFLAWSVYDLIN